MDDQQGCLEKDGDISSWSYDNFLSWINDSRQLLQTGLISRSTSQSTFAAVKEMKLRLQTKHVQVNSSNDMLN